MKHYRIVKKSTHILIAISAFAVIFNALFLGAIATGLVQLSSPSPAKADSCSTEGVSINLESGATKFQVNEIILVRIAGLDETKHYKYQMYMKDVSTGTIYPKGTEETIDVASERHETVRSSGVGEKIVFAKYILYDAPNWCSNWTSTNEIPITVGDNTADSANITITAPEKTEQGGTAVISYTIAGALDKTYTLYISAGGTCPDEPENEKCWYDKVSGPNIITDPLEESYNWAPQSTTETGRHGVMIKLFNKTTGELTDKKIVYTTICAPGTAATSCVANNGSGNATPASGSTSDKITTPNEIAPFSKFTAAFKLPKQINGAGDLTIIIIDLIFYLLGGFAFIGIVVSGIQYITSGGDTAKAEKAKKTLIYCVTGIVVAVLALTLQSIATTFWSGPN